MWSFDLEIAREIPEGTKDWKELAPLGITCAANYNGERCVEFHDYPKLSKQHACDLVEWMYQRHEAGERFLTWNGTSFDFQVLAQESGLWRECVEICLSHVDLMLIATISKGWFVGLDSALKAHGIQSKLHKVQLKDGSWIEDMSGSKAPAMWKAGETKAVLEYLRGDVERPLELVQSIQRIKKLCFDSKSGKRHVVEVPKLWTVAEMMEKPMADNSWMDQPPTKRQFVEWMIPYLPEVEEWV